MTILKPDYEACFKEGYNLGTRLTRSKLAYMRAKDASLIGDEAMAAHHREYGETWRDMAKNSGRKYTPPVAHEPKQRMLDLGDHEVLAHEELEIRMKKAL
tara:strand:+ start:28 stop:327 length:300 start_codon:yes stop_codon:yes gene_type:complete